MIHEFEVLTAETAAKGIDVVKNEHLDLVVLDVGLPDMDGREMCKHLRKHGFKKPILMLTGNSSDADQVLGFHGVREEEGLLEGSPLPHLKSTRFSADHGMLLCRR